MNSLEILQKLAAKAGQPIKITMESHVPFTKNNGAGYLVKRTSGEFITGIAYYKRAENAGKEHQPLPWGEWVQFPYFVQNGDDIHLALFPPTEAQAATFKLGTHTAWFNADGSPCDNPENFVGAKAEPRDRRPGKLLPKIESIVSIE